MPRALIISRYFPPLSSAGGSLRLVKLLKHLSTMGWDFIVMTQDTERPVIVEQPLSAFLLQEVPASADVRRVPAPFAAAARQGSDYGLTGKARDVIRSLLGNSGLAWSLRVLAVALRETAPNSIDIVAGETPPFTNALAAVMFSWLRRKPLVFDLKDDWVGSASFKAKSLTRQRLETLVESLIVRRAAAVITVTPQSHQMYLARYAGSPAAGRIHLVPNGCDLEEYETLKGRERKPASDQFLILSAAWGFRKDYRDISPFLRGLADFLTRRPEAREALDVVLLGDSLSEEYDAELRQLGLDKVIRKAGAVSRCELVEWLWKADLHLLIQPVGNHTAISGTLYEYWATGKAPVLLIAEDGASATLVVDRQIGAHFRFDEVAAVGSYIEQVFDAYRGGQPIWIERNGVEQFDRKQLACQMDAIWQRALNAG